MNLKFFFFFRHLIGISEFLIYIKYFLILFLIKGPFSYLIKFPKILQTIEFSKQSFACISSYIYFLNILYIYFDNRIAIIIKN